MKSKGGRAEHHPHELPDGQCIEVSTRNTKRTITFTGFIVMGQNNFMQCCKPASKDLVHAQHTHTKPKTNRNKKEHVTPTRLESCLKAKSSLI